MNLTIREDKQKGIYVAGVTEEYVTSHEELMGIMGAGEFMRGYLFLSCLDLILSELNCTVLYCTVLYCAVLY